MKRALLAVLLVISFRGFSEELFYASNAIGMLLQRVPSYRRDESEWIVGVVRGADTEVRRLLDKGKETRRWEITWTSDQKVERELAGDILQARRIYDGAGTLLQEEQYKDGVLTQKSFFTYVAARLARMRVVDAAGTQIYAEEYSYATNGALRQVRRTGAPGEVTRSSIVGGAAGISEERVAGTGGEFVIRYDVHGRVESREERQAGKLVSREDFVFASDSDALVSSSLSLPADATRVERRYDAGLLLTETTTTKGNIVQVDTYARDQEGRVTVKTRQGPSGIETWRYTFDDTGTVKREQYSLRGSIVKVTLYGEKSQRVEELYTDGEVFLKVYYDGDTRLREEVYSGGTMLRERTFP
jgi:hypothetical protein